MINKLKEGIGKWASLTAVLLLCLLATRLLFAMELHFRMGLEWQQLVPMFSGAWLDILPAAFIGAVALAPFVLLYLWFPRLAKGLYIAAIVLIVLATVSLEEYYCNMMMPLDHVLLIYSSDDIKGIVSSSVAITFAQVFWYLVTILVSVGVLFVLRRWIMPLYASIAVAVLSVVLVLSVNYKKIIREERFYDNHGDFCLAINQLSYSYTKITDYMRDSRKRKTYGGVDDEQLMVAAVRYQAAHPEFKFVSPEYPFYHHNENEDVIGGFFNETSDGLPPNFVFIVIESFGQHLTSVDDQRLTLTPFIDSLKHESLYWKNCLSTSERTFGALPSIFASTPYGEKGFGFYFDVMPEHRSLLSDMQRNGYTTNFYYGVLKDVERYDAFLQQNLVDYIYKPTMENIDSAKFAYLDENHRWGIDDRELFDYVRQYKTNNPSARPHTDIIMTLSTHEPFFIDGIELYENRVKEWVENTPDITSREKKNVLGNINVFACYAYLDECVRNLIDYYSTLPEYANTVFVITGDHRTAQQPYNQLVRYNVPLLIWSPLLKEHKTMDAVTSHLCIVPTLEAYLNHQYQFDVKNYSHWIAPVADTASSFRNTLKQAFMQNNRDVIEYISGDYYINGTRLYKMHDGMNLESCDDKDVYETMKAELNDFNMLSRYAVHGNKLLDARNDIYNVVVAEQNLPEEQVIKPDDEFVRLILTTIDCNLSLMEIAVRFDMQSTDTLKNLPSLVIQKGSLYHAVPLVSVTGRSLNTGEKEHFQSVTVAPTPDDTTNEEFRIYLWNKEKCSMTFSNMKIDIKGYAPSMVKKD